MNNTTKKKTYKAPELTVVAVRQERGYAGSTLRSLALLYILDGDNSVESRDNSGGFWGGGDETQWN